MAKTLSPQFLILYADSVFSKTSLLLANIGYYKMIGWFDFKSGKFCIFHGRIKVLIFWEIVFHIKSISSSFLKKSIF